MWNENEKEQVGKDQEKAQSEKDSHSKNRGGKKPNQQPGTQIMKHIVSRMSSHSPNRRPPNHLNLTKNMKTHTRHQQHKNFFTHQDIKQKEPPQKYRLGTISNTVTGGLKPVLHGHNLTLSFCSGPLHLVSYSVLVVNL